MLVDLMSARKVIGYIFLILGVTLLVSTLTGWIPPDALESLMNRKSQDGFLSHSEPYKVSYYWSNTSPTLFISIKFPPQNITLILSDPDGVTIKKEKITKENLLDEKELIAVSFRYLPFKTGEYTLILYNPNTEEVIYRKSIELFETPKVSIGNITPKGTVRYDKFLGKIVYHFNDIYFNITNLNPTPVMIYSKVEIISQNNKESVSIDCVFIPPKRSVVLNPLYVPELHTEPTENHVTILVTVYDCFSEKQLDSEKYIIKIRG